MPGLTWLDYLVVAIYLAVVVTIGLYFARRQTGTDAYYAGSRRMPVWAVGLSVLATLISSVTFLAYPGEGYESNWIRLVQGLTVPIVLLSVVWFLVPCYRRVIRLSAYEYFEKRFGFLARLYSSLAFALVHFSKMGTVFFLLALAISKMTGFDMYHVILVVGAFTILYTLVGGIEAVIWSDVLQGFVLVAGGLICVVVLLLRSEGGPGAALESAWQAEKVSFGPYDWDFTRLTFVVMALNGVFYALQKYGTDQTIVQRFLVTETDGKAIKASLTGALLCVPVWTLFMLIGTLLWSFYQSGSSPLPQGTRPRGSLPLLHHDRTASRPDRTCPRSVGRRCHVFAGFRPELPLRDRRGGLLPPIKSGRVRSAVSAHGALGRRDLRAALRWRGMLVCQDRRGNGARNGLHALRGVFWRDRRSARIGVLHATSKSARRLHWDRGLHRLHRLCRADDHAHQFRRRQAPSARSRLI